MVSQIKAYVRGFVSFPKVNRLLRADVEAFRRSNVEIESLLRCPYWQVRNVAIKLIARFSLSDYYPVLSEKVSTRNDLPIIRRNCVRCLAQLRLGDPASVGAIETGLCDPYWEVRAESLKALADMRDIISRVSGRIVNRFFRAGDTTGSQRGHADKEMIVLERNFEVLVVLGYALGRAGEGQAAFDALSALTRVRNWIVRAQACVGLAELASREPGCRAMATEVLLGVDGVSDGSTPYFVLREKIAVAHKLVDKHEEDPERDIVPLYIDMGRGWFAAVER